MMKIPIITQNFSSPDVYTDTPLMLLPQAPQPPLPDRDQEGFSQLLLHDLHRHRQSYVRSYTAFETLKKRQDFVLRQENLRSLQSFEQRIHAKQDQLLDQSIHSYEQCFVKVINGNLNINGNVRQPHKRVKSTAPSFDKFHSHQLSHIPATPLDTLPITPFHRYQKSHRPPKYRSQTSLYRSAQSFHDAFQTSSFSNHSQPFLSFTESYLQKYADRSSSRLHLPTNHDEMGGIREKHEGEEEEGEEGEQKQQQTRSASVEPNLLGNKNKKLESRPKISDLQHIRATISSQNTNTPSSTPQMGYHDAIRDGLTALQDNEDHNEKISPLIEKRRSSQQSNNQLSNNNGKTSIKRPKTGKKKAGVVNITSDKKNEPITSTKPADNDLLKSAMFVQNYESSTTSTTTQNLPAKVERPPMSVNTTRKPPSILRRSSLKSTDSNVALKQTLENIDTQMKTTEQINIDNNNKETLVVPTTTTTTNTTLETKRDVNEQQLLRLEIPDNRKRIKKGAFDSSESMNDLVAFELGLMGSNRGAMRKNRFRSGKESIQNDEELETTPDNQATLDLLEKIRQSSTGLAVGQPPVSQQGCRFELPFDLKLLEQLTPLEYLSKYCRLSSRRNYHFKRIFDKYRNNQYRFESSNLYSAILDVHTEMFTRVQYENLCQLIDLGNEQHQFTFDTFGGILALSERMLYDSSRFHSGLDEPELAKDTLEKCDFDSLDRKFHGLQIRESMKRLLNTL